MQARSATETFTIAPRRSATKLLSTSETAQCGPRRLVVLSVIALSLFLICHPSLEAYSVLSHEAIIDTVWATDILPLLKQRFPGATPEQLREAHAYAYGGAIIQDLGYYPYGDKFFSDLAHYVRSGDFVSAMLRDAEDLNQFAFALGSVSHYGADNEGHSLAVNRAVPLLYPNLKKKFGDNITYEDNPVAHVKTEFGFDVLEVAKGRYAPDDYRDFIGFEVAAPLLARAFKDTYGLELSSVLHDEPKALGSYRHAVSKIIPKATRVAWQLKKDSIENDMPGTTRRKFLYNLSRASYERKWGKDYRKATAGEKVLAFLLRLIPKVGPLKVLAFRTPTPETEQLFQASFNAAVDRYRSALRQLRTGPLPLANDNLDVGKATPAGQYRLNDRAYTELLHRLATQNFYGLPPALETDIETYFATAQPPSKGKKEQREWSRTQLELTQLKSSQSTPASNPDQ